MNHFILEALVTTKKVIKQVTIFVILVVVVVFAPIHAAADDPTDITCIGPFGDCALYDPSCSSDSAADNSPENQSGSTDIRAVAAKYGLQSAMIQEVEGGTIASYKANVPPKTPASTMKLVIADVLLRENLSLGKHVRITRDLYYDGGNDLGSSNVTLGVALQKMLGVSSNVGANAIMKALGGVDSFTQKAHQYGYTHTEVNGYYDPSNDGKNISTISDQVTAMNHIFSGQVLSQDNDYKVAQDALQAASKTSEGNHYGVDDDANKWGGTSDVASNVGKFKVGSKDYIIGLYYNGSMDSSKAKAAMKSGSADLLKTIDSGASGGGSADNISAQDSQCCSQGGDAGDSGGNDSGGDSGKWDSGLKPPYILEQWAIEVLKDLAQKKGKSPSDAVTKQHVLALVAFALGEGGDINNDDLFNPLNTGIAAPDLVQGGHSVSGVQSFKSFDAGVEAAARTLAKKQYSRLATALLKPDSTAKQFMYALSYNWKYPGGAIWAEQSRTDPTYYSQRLSLVKQTQANYKNIAGLIIGTSAHEQPANKKDVSKLQFADGNGAVDVGSACDGSVNGDAQGIAQMAVKLSWPDESHGVVPTKAYASAYTRYNKNGPGLADCGGFVATVMHASGADKNYPAGGTGAQEAYVRSHKDKYDVVDKVKSVNDLQPGDILIVNAGSGEGAAGHTWIYVGKQPPHNYYGASASLGSRAAGLGNPVLHDGRGDYLRARLK